MKKKIRKNTQLSFVNPKGAGRPALHDKAIRHIARPKFIKGRALHLTIKVKESKADIQNKQILKKLKHAIFRARLKELKIIHFALEYNHVHLMVEASSHEVLHKSMQALGISFSKGINSCKKKKGTVYKHRYHFRQISSRRDMKNVASYILQNHRKHRSGANFNSLALTTLLDEGKIFKTRNFLFRENEERLLNGQNLLYE